MIALDTNVLVRFLVADDPVQSAASSRLIERAIARDESLYLSELVICETVWVLAGSYRVPRQRIIAMLRDLLRARHLVFSAPERLSRALDAFEKGKGDLADYLIREDASRAGYATVATLDKVLWREEGFTRPG
jgi:predicted nucleic-acid-binding protein